PEDRMARMQRKLEDYFQMGCRNIWILDPFRKKAFTFDGTATTEVHDKLSIAERDITLKEIFPPDS
ncbi:MAG: Uma2 family endonuclease, partial [Bryobacteraceae bacterium]